MLIEMREVPTGGSIYKPSSPYEATIIENRRLTAADSNDDVRHIRIDLRAANFRYREGQSIGVIPPGNDERGKRHRPRLYTISSAAPLDDEAADEVTITVKRVVVKYPLTGEIFTGLASGFLCDRRVGDKVTITGPVGRNFFLPADDGCDLILIAAGTGIAPFRSFIEALHREHEAGRNSYRGEVNLFYGVRSPMEQLYMNDEANDLGEYLQGTTYKAFTAFSRHKSRPKEYVQDLLVARRAELWQKLRSGKAAIYICGLVAMEQQIEELLRNWAEADGLDWEEFKTTLKEEKRYHIEVY